MIVYSSTVVLDYNSSIDDDDDVVVETEAISVHISMSEDFGTEICGNWESERADEDFVYSMPLIRGGRESC